MTDLSEVAGMVLVEVDAMVVLTTGVTATTGVLSVFADTSVAVRHVSAQLSSLPLPRRHLSGFYSLCNNSNLSNKFAQ